MLALTGVRGISCYVFDQLGVPQYIPLATTAAAKRRRLRLVAISQVWEEVRARDCLPRAFQNFCARRIAELYVPNDLVLLAARRCLALCGVEISPTRWEQVIAVTSALARVDVEGGDGGRPRTSYAYWRFVLGTWPTARRFQQAPEQCYFDARTRTIAFSTMQNPCPCSCPCPCPCPCKCPCLFPCPCSCQCPHPCPCPCDNQCKSKRKAPVRLVVSKKLRAPPPAGAPPLPPEAFLPHGLAFANSYEYLD